MLLGFADRGSTYVEPLTTKNRVFCYPIFNRYQKEKMCARAHISSPPNRDHVFLVGDAPFLEGSSSCAMENIAQRCEHVWSCSYNHHG